MADRPIAFGKAEPVRSETNLWKRVNADSDLPEVLYYSFRSVTPAAAEEMGREYLRAEKGTLSLTDTDLDQLVYYFSRKGLAGTTVRFHQEWKEVPVFGGEVSLTVRPDNVVVMVNVSYVRDAMPAEVTPVLTAAAARQITLDYLSPNGRVSDETRKLVILPTKDGTKLAYRITLVAMDPMGEWEVFVDAKTGELLRVTDIAAYHKHRAEPAEVPFPMLVQGTGNVFNPDPLSSANATYGDAGFTDNNDNTTPQLIAQQISVTLQDITFSGGTYFLKGPYAEITDDETPFRGIFSQSSSTWNVNRDDNAFEAVNVYYHIDASMRYLNETLGIDVHPTDYSGGVKCDPSGLDNIDNSHYVGASQRLAWGDGGVDDAEDSDVIHHELGHGLHDWITGGGLSQNQGLSEGCGDYWAASYNRSLGDWTSSDPAYYYVFNWDGHNDFWSGRICNYATTWSNNLFGGIHTQGQVWSTSMMQVYDAIGKMKTDLIFWEGIAMTNGGSNQNDAANAVYQAALSLPALTDEDELMVHTILTARGYILPDFGLPVEWLSFHAEATEKTVLLDWATASERDNAGFAIERSNDNGRTFTTIGRVAGAGVTTAQTAYLFVDEAPLNGTNLYRLKQQDADGAVAYSDVRKVDFKGTGTAASLAPNPVAGTLRVRRIVPATEPFAVSVIDLQGREVLRREAVLDDTPFSVASLPAGVYLLRYPEGKEMVTLRFVKQ